MGKHEPIRARESGMSFAREVQVIDVQFTEVSGPRRTLWGRIKLALQAIVWAAAIGFLIPPAWALIQIIGQTLATH